MAMVVYLLCALTSVGCALLLFRQYRRMGGDLLLWSTACFLLLAIANVLLFLDMAVLPKSADLSLARTITNFAGMSMLLYGLIRQST